MTKTNPKSKVRNPQPNADDLAALATGRSRALFADDAEHFHTELTERIRGRRILVIGGAGSIGSATVKTILPFRPACVHIVDQSENTLVELVRDLRSRLEPGLLENLTTLPLNFGGPIMQRLLAEEAPYDFVLNFAALKHVRSEKSSFSILQMLDTNVIKAMHLLRWAADRGNLQGYFSVSTDKAANPVNLMGASKRLMEHVIFSDGGGKPRAFRVASARFANVAFSDGSLLQGWLNRIAKGQPLAAPRETRRYFVSLEEAGQICLLAAFLAPDRHVLAPRLDPSKDLVDLSEIAVKVLGHFGYEAEIFTDETEARLAASQRQGNRYPLLLTPLDTSGEKPYEEFVGQGESSIDTGMKQLMAIPYLPVDSTLLFALLAKVEGYILAPNQPVQSQELVAEIQRVLPEFHHQLTLKSLDQRM